MDTLDQISDAAPPVGSGGANQVGVRHHNERLLLTVLRQSAALSKAEIARRTGLSAQTVTVITRQLERDGLISRGTPVRGRVGQPSVPMSLAPDGAYSIGLKIGRRSAELALMDFCGTLRAQLRETYAYPLPETILSFVRRGLPKLRAAVSRPERIAGLGIAIPFELWNWAEKVGAPAASMAAWRDLDMVEAVAEVAHLPIVLENDCSAACSAEVMLGHGREQPNFAYFFVGFFIGGGLALNRSTFTGVNQAAGAMGPLPVGRTGGRVVPLLDFASLVRLEESLQRDGIDPSILWTSPDDWSVIGTHLDRWVAQAAEHLAVAAISVCCVIDFDCVVVDGAFPAGIGARLAEATNAAVATHNLAGIRRFTVVPGAVGSAARVVGAAALPLQARYMVNPQSLYGAPAP